MEEQVFPPQRLLMAAVRHCNTELSSRNIYQNEVCFSLFVLKSAVQKYSVFSFVQSERFLRSDHVTSYAASAKA